MEVSFTNQVKAPFTKKTFLPVFEKTLKKTGRGKEGVISLVLTDRKTIKKLNRIYRGQDKVTGILTFVFRESENFIKPKTDFLGEIFICYPEAVKKAKKNKNEITKELKKLALHGLLHLLGYQHKNKKERAQMEGLEESIIKGIN